MVHSDALISMVLPTYNGARFLADSIQSCLDQTYPHWELIVVDDASTDATSCIAADYARMDSRVRVVSHTVNSKLPAALNTGFRLARGDYFTWTSDDNLYRPQALEAMLGVLEANPEVGVVYADHSRIDEEGRLLDVASVPPPEELLFRNGVGACFLYRRAVQEQVGPYAEDLFLAEDYDFWLRASCYAAMQPLHQDLYLYRLHRQSLTESRAQGVLEATVRTLERNLPQMRWPDQSLLGRAYAHLGSSCLSLGDMENAQQHMAKAFSTHRLLDLDPAFGLQHLVCQAENELRPAETVAQLIEGIEKTGGRASGLRRRAWAKYHEIGFFAGYQEGDLETVRRHLAKLLWYTPRMALNVGYLSISSRVMLGHTLSSALRWLGRRGRRESVCS